MSAKQADYTNTANIMPYLGIAPRIDPTVFLAPGVHIIGDVHIGEHSSVWFNSVARGDVFHIRIGRYTNIQDLCMLHVTTNKYALHIGNFVTVGHAAVLHGCTVEDACLIGMGSRVLDNARVRARSMVAAGAVVREGFEVPEGTLVAGVPARVVRELSIEEVERIEAGARHYALIADNYRNPGTAA